VTRRSTSALVLLTAAVVLWGSLVAGPVAGARASPAIEAASAVLVDARDGAVLYRRNAQVRRQIASTTKLMTALLALEQLPLRRRLSAPAYHAGPQESLIGLEPGERMTVRDLLRGLLLASANDAAVTLAGGVAGSVPRFVGEMNRKAVAVGLADTHYANPVGLDQRRNFSTAFDLVRLSRMLLRNRTFARIVRMPQARLRSGLRPRLIENRNDLVERFRWIVGVKTGHTARAGYVLVGAARRKGVRLLSVVLGEPSLAQRDRDTLALLRYGLSRYRRVRLLRAGSVQATPKIDYYGDRKAKLIAPGGLSVSARRGQRVEKAVEAPSEVKGPISRGTRLGRVFALVDGKRVASVPLVTADAVPRAGAARKLVHDLTRPVPTLVVLAIAVFAVARSRGRRLRI
jgi:serine-type D-Ala-D-Ala carboxypeptidase (penicillin-binding protein 5/6)